jgi:hypothetical protein
MKDSSIDSRYREQDPELAKQTDKFLEKNIDLHGAGATLVDVKQPEPPDQAAKTQAARETQGDKPVKVKPEDRKGP